MENINSLKNTFINEINKINKYKNINSIKYVITIKNFNDFDKFNKYANDNTFIIPIYMDGVTKEICELIACDILNELFSDIEILFNIDNCIKLDNEIIDAKEIIYIQSNENFKDELTFFNLMIKHQIQNSI